MSASARIRFVLVGTQHPGNIGAAARALKTMGLARLVLESARSAAVIVVEHDMVIIRQIAKFVTVFNRGAIFREAMIDEIMADREVQEIYLGKQANVASA